MSEYYEETNDVAVTSYDPTRGDSWMEVRAYTFPDGSVKNHLDADGLRDVAQMLENAAKKLEERNRD